eukprot:s5708_g2.t1
MRKPLSVQHIIAIPLQNAIFSSFSLKQWRDASTMPPSTQDPSYWEEYRAYCQTREEAQLPVVSYRNYLRQWSRSAREHGKGKEPKGGADGGDGKGGGKEWRYSLFVLLGYPTEVEGNAGWFRFQYRSPNELEAQQVEVAYPPRVPARSAGDRTPLALER